MTVARDTRRITINVPAALAADVDRPAQDAGLTASAWAARWLGVAVRSINAEAVPNVRSQAEEAVRRTSGSTS